MSKFRDYDKYEVYPDGHIFSYYTNKFLKPKTNKNGYQVVLLYDNEGNRKMYYLHRVVYEAVSGEPIPPNMQVNHIDENKENNAISNLNLMSPKQNTNYGTCISRRANTQSKQVGAFKNGKLVITFKSTQEARRNGFNQCSVWSCCNGKRKTHKGYTWRYLN